MQKVLLMSVLIATLVIPFRNARLPAADESARRTMRDTCWFVAAWGLACAYVYWYLPH